MTSRNLFLAALLSAALPAVAGAASPAWPEQKVVASDGQADDQFGLHTVIDGDVALVSAPLAPGGTWQGVVYAFEKVDGAWTQTQVITASDAAPSNEFGGYLALVGDTAFVGAPEAPGASGPDRQRGAVYVFVRADGRWIQTQKLLAADGMSFDAFGGAIAFDGTTAMIASNNEADGGVGAIYVFTKVAGLWTQAQKITATGDPLPGSLGASIAVRGDIAFASALDFNPDTAEGRVCVFERGGDGTWTQVQTIVSPNASGDYFGDSIAYDGSSALIGAPSTTVGANPWQGAVHVYTRTGGTWAPVQELTAPDGAENDIFGFVAMSGHTALVGAQHANGRAGAAYVFDESHGLWTLTEKLTPSDGVPGDEFAPSQIAISPSTAVVGAWGASIGGHENQGAAYFYSRDAIFRGGFEASP